MIVDVVIIPGLFDRAKAHGKSIAVIDVLRSSSTLITAMANGAKDAFLFGTPDEAKAKKRDLNSHDILLCGERNGMKVAGFDLGNSPSEYSSRMVRGKTLFFTSTNGSKMLQTAAATAGKLILAGFNNITAAAEVLNHQGRDCVLLCSGKEGRFSLEDAVCAGMLVETMKQHRLKPWSLTDEAFSAVLLYRHFKDDLIGLMHFCEHGQSLKHIGMESDFDSCARIDCTTVVPQFRRGSLGLD